MQEGNLNLGQLEDANTSTGQEEIARSVLASTGRSEQYDLQDLENVTVYYGGDLTENKEDVVISVSFGPKNTVIAAYMTNGDVYEYVGDIGNFYGVENIRFIPSKELGQDIVVVRERVNQSLGSFEETDVLRGYVYEEDGFRDVLNTPAKIKASWNKLWDNTIPKDESQWRRITENTESVWGTEGNTDLTLTRQQSYLISDDTNKEKEPENDTFQTQDSRVVVERFYWSPVWGRFILGDAVERVTGEPVALVENLEKSPYTLAGFSNYADFGIVRGDGTFAYVPEEELEQINL